MPTKFYAIDGSTASIINNNGNYFIIVNKTDGSQSLYYIPGSASQASNSTSTMDFTTLTFYSSNKEGIAKIGLDQNKMYNIKATDANGSNIVFYSNPPSKTNSPTTTCNPSNTPANPSYATPSSVPASTSTSTSTSTCASASGSKVGMGSNSYSTATTGIPKSMIAPGTEDLYILKSQILPPICPAPIINFPSGKVNDTCPPCPTTRCPQSSFDCKKVPNYNAINEEYLPQPMLNSFSKF
jgi:hypothetical protein